MSADAVGHLRTRVTWDSDRAALLEAGYEIEVVRERPTFVEAIVRRRTESVILQWTHDSAFTATTNPASS